jgi:hypothetical protein
MKDTKDIVCCVVDNGIFIHVARRLAREYKKVYYWSPADCAFPSCRQRCVGDGYPDIERVESIWDVKSECDLFVFPDIGFSGLQKELVSQGYPVWGARDGDELETNRGAFLKMLETTGLPVPEYEAIQGLNALTEYLKDKTDLYIKVSKIRGDFETFHWRSFKEDQILLCAAAVKLGPLREFVTFYVFTPVDSKIEDGIDSYCIDGQWPQTVIHGVECKDKSYLGTFQKYDDLPDVMRKVNDAFGPILKKYGYRSRFSTEVRITDAREGYFIDPTCRCGSPPSQCEMEMVENWGEIMWHGSQGILVEMEPAAKFGVQALIRIKRDKWWTALIPKELDQWVKVSFSCCIDGLVCVPPDDDPDAACEIGWLVAIGDTIEDAIETLHEHKAKLPDGCHCEVQSIAELIEEIHKAEEMGMIFTSQEIPEPEVAL